MTPDQMRDASLLELFRLEAEAQTQVLNAGLMALERSPTQADQLEACMRAAHSLKGAARIVGLDAGVRVAHVMEDCLVEAQDGRLLLQSEHIDALLQGCDLLLRIGTPPAGDAGWAEGAGREEIDGLVLRLEGLVRSGLPLARAELPATTPGLPEAAPEAPPATTTTRSPPGRRAANRPRSAAAGSCGSPPNAWIGCWISPASRWWSSSASSRWPIPCNACVACSPAPAARSTWYARRSRKPPSTRRPRPCSARRGN